MRDPAAQGNSGDVLESGARHRDLSVNIGECLMIGWMVLAYLVVLATFPRSAANWRAQLFEAVDRFIAGVKSGRIGFWLVALAAAMVFGTMFAPELAWLAALDVATYLEVLAAVIMVRATVRIDAVRKAVALTFERVAQVMRVGLARIVRAARGIRARKPRIGRTPPPDEDLGFAFA